MLLIPLALAADSEIEIEGPGGVMWSGSARAEACLVEVLQPEEQVSNVITAEPTRRSTTLAELVGPPRVATPLVDGTEFLALVAPMVSPDQLDSATAWSLANTFYDQGQRAAQLAGLAGEPLNDEVTRWMALAVPLYRRVAAGPVHHPERVASRYAWAARLGGGTDDDLERAAALLPMLPESDDHPPLDPAGLEAERAWLALGDAWLEDAHWAPMKALGALHQAGLREQTPAMYWATGWAHYYLGEHGTAISLLKAAVSTADQRKTSAELSLELFQRTAAGNPAPRRTTMDPSIMKHLASTYEQQGKRELAIEMLKRVNNGYPDDEDAWVQRALLLDPAAIDHVLAAGTRAPELAGAFMEAGTRAQFDHDPRARELYTTALQIDPSNPHADCVRVLADELSR